MEGRKKIGILNQGKNNRFIDNTFVNLDIGIKDEGENTFASGNKFFNKKNIQIPIEKTNEEIKVKSWFLKNLSEIIIGITVILIGGFLLYKLGWN